LLRFGERRRGAGNLHESALYLPTYKSPLPLPLGGKAGKEAGTLRDWIQPDHFFR